MTDLADWMGARRPPAPPPLASWLTREVRGRTRSPVDLMDAAIRALERARPGRTRASAFELLGADALITYACEAALDEEDPAAVLTGFIRDAAASHR